MRGRSRSELRLEIDVELNGRRARVPVVLDRAAVEAIGVALADVIGAARTSPWIYGDKAAAEYLGWPVGRVQKLSARRVLPAHRIGQRKAYRRDELDAALADHSDGRL